MSTRNPMNERYTSDEKHGVTRKSAAAAKPKTKAAASVYIEPTEKTPAQKKAIRKEERRKQQELNAKYYKPDTKRYKTLKRIWWALLITAIVCTALSWFLQSSVTPALTYVMIGLAYVCIIAALILDFTKIRKERNEYAARMAGNKSKEARAAQKREKAEERAQRAEAAEKLAAAQEEEAQKPKGLKRFFGGSKKKNAAAAEADAASGTAEDETAKESAK